MKPRAQEESAAEASSAKDKDSGRAGGKGAAGTAKTAANKNNQASADAIGGGAQGKKKQPSATSAAGRKIARKTAHSLIERRRRSKMNEEFAVLKSMIPACTGEMHKLAILQVSKLDNFDFPRLTREPRAPHGGVTTRCRCFQCCSFASSSNTTPSAGID